MAVTNDALFAHVVAQHLRAIVNLLPLLSPEDQARFDAASLESVASAIEASHPVEPLTDKQKSELCSHFAEQLAWRSQREVVEDYCGDWTEAEWRSQWEQYVETQGED